VLLGSETLFVNGNPTKDLDIRKELVLESFLTSPFIKDLASTFNGPAELRPIPKGSFELNVMQKEFATVPRNSPVKIVGSQDATTCHILILRSKSSGKVCCAHFDTQKQLGGKDCSLKAMLQTFDPEEQSQGLETHIIGGFDDANDYSFKISKNLIYELYSEPKVVFHISTCCIFIQNDYISNGHHFPKID